MQSWREVRRRNGPVVTALASLGSAVGRWARTDTPTPRPDLTTTLLRSLREGVVVFDTENRVIDVNPRWCELVGRPPGELIGATPPYPWQIAGADPPPAGEELIQRPDGTRVSLLATIAPVLDARGEARARVATFVDITERKRAEQDLAARAAELQLANSQLIATNQQLATAAEFKTDLMSVVSHEMSQPLSSIASLAELLTSDWDQLTNEIRLDLATKIDKNARRLTGMVTDLLLLFRLDAGVVTPRRASVPVAEVVDALADAAPDGAALISTVDPNLCALVDRGHLWQVLMNLVSNAAKYGEPPIEIGTDQRPDGVLVTVRDHGPGIPQDFLPHLFDRFTRAGAGGVRVGKGSGLGLFIVRHLVEINGGEIWYETADPRGARLVMRLPAATRPVVPAAGAR